MSDVTLPESATTTPPESAAAPRRSSGRWIGFIVFVALLAAGGVSYQRYAALHAGSQQLSGNLDTLDAQVHNNDETVTLHEKRIEALEEKVRQLEERKPEAAPAPADTPSASAPIPGGNDVERIAALEKEVAELKAAPRSSGGGIAATTQAIKLFSVFSRLGTAVASGRPFATELAAFVDESGGDENAGPLASLAPYADSGVPTLEGLFASFEDAADAATGADETPPDNAGFWARFVYNVTHMVKIRKIQDAGSGNSVNAIIARAQTDLQNGEVEAALAEIKTLPELPQSSFSTWIEDAQMTLDTPELLSRLEEDVMRKALHADAKPAAGGKAEPSVQVGNQP